MSLLTPKKKYPLKLLGIDNTICSYEEVLEFLGLYVSPSSIDCVHFDSIQKFYVVFLNDIDSVCTLVGKRLSYSQCKIDILPLLDYYIVRNVYPDLTNEDLIDLFRPFGNVYNADNHYVLPNSSKFSHVLSGDREISFKLPGYEVGVSVPGSVVYLPHAFHVIKYCPACSTEGHAMLNCPDIEDGGLPQETLVELENDIELEDTNGKREISDDDKFHIANESSEESNVLEHSLEEVDSLETVICGTLENSQETARVYKAKEMGKNCMDTELTSSSKTDESREESNVGEHSLEKVDSIKTICGTLENSQETTKVYKAKRKRKKENRMDTRWTWITKTRKDLKTVIYFVKRKYERLKGHEKHNRLHVNSGQNKEKKSRKKGKKKRAYCKRKGNYKLEHTLKCKGIQETKVFLKKASLRKGRPRKNPRSLNQLSSLQNILLTTSIKRGRPRKCLKTINSPPLQQKVNEKKLLRKGRPRKNPKFSGLTPSQQGLKEKTSLRKGRPRKNPESLNQLSSLQNILLTASIKRGRPRKCLKTINPPPLQQKTNEKTPLKRGRRRKNPKSVNQPSLQQNFHSVASLKRKYLKTSNQPPSLQKVTEKTLSSRGRPRKNPLVSGLTSSQQGATEKTSLSKEGPRKRPEVLDKTPSPQVTTEKICLGCETPRKDEISIQTRLLQTKITDKIYLGSATQRKDEASFQTPLISEEITVKKLLTRGRPRRNPKILVLTPSQQGLKEKTSSGKGIRRKRLKKVLAKTPRTLAPLLPEEIKGKTLLSKGRPRKNPEVLSQTPSQQSITEISSDENEVYLKPFSLPASLEKIIQNSGGILPVFVLKHLLLMDLRNKKDIFSYISKFTVHFYQVFCQLKKLHRQVSESEDFINNIYYQKKLFCLMRTLLRQLR